jgi:hypothetical protein
VKLTFRIHAIERMAKWGVNVRDVEHVLANGETIEDYPEDSPYPSRLLLARLGNRALHLVAAYNRLDVETIVVTVYEPDPAQWSPDFRRRLP